ncbi:MAG: AMP-binding protein [Parachlamydiaceae bacterium]|nr:AMP-binding protein [Parachlamydiaceae bacterium]
MKNIIALLMLYIVRFALWFRYRVTIKGVENLNSKTLNKPGGVLFLPNHPTAFVDPTLVTMAVWKKYPLRPMVVEYMYYTPGIHTMMRFLDAIPVPNFVTASNSLKKKKADQVMETVIDLLKKGDNFLIYPAGKTKHQAREIIGASGVHRIIEANPETNIVLVRTTGLWGSKFSRALNGSIPYIFSTIFWGIKEAFKSLLFFLPRREVTIEFVPAPADFPYKGTRLEMNRYLEKWYNRPDGLSVQTEEEPGETLTLVSYSMWKNELPEIKTSAKSDEEVHVTEISQDIKNKITQKLSEMSQIPADQIRSNMDLGADLGLDSLDSAELISYLDDEFDCRGIPLTEMSSVGKVMALAAKQVTIKEESEDEQMDLSKWFQPRSREKLIFPSGETIPRVFFNLCSRKNKEAIVGDDTAGVLTYADAKLRVILLAEYIRKLPGEYIGILLPSSVAAYLTIIATQLAGKVPLMINWTVGSRHLESVVALSGVKVVLSSWAFLDKLENVDLNGVEDMIVMLEDAKRDFSLFDKLKAVYRSKLSVESILSIFNADKQKKEDPAVLLFTSGTESLPKGVPLTHENILSNQRAGVEEIGLFQDDVMLGILPPFHSFGFTVSGLLPLLSGMRVAYFPDPTNGKGVAKAIKKWKATLVCGAPSFLKGIFRSAQSEQLNTLRYCFTGAEKAPEDLFKMVNSLDHCRLIEGYGITECSPILTVNMKGDTENGVGRPLKGTTISIVTLDDHRPLKMGEQGLVLAKGPNIFKGYLNKGLSSPFISLQGEDWYSTGDLGYINEHGSLILSGRLKRFIKIGGEMISLGAIEAAFHKMVIPDLTSDEGPSIAVCAKEEVGEKAKIIVYSTFPLTVQDANRILRDAGFSNLVKIFKTVELEEIPLMGSGKVNYRELDGKLTQIIENEENLIKQ